MALMKSFANNEAPRPKRQKLDSSVDQPEVRDKDALAHQDGEQRDVDLVEELDELEEEADDGIPDGDLSDGDEQPDVSDQFETHFASPDENDLARRLKAIRDNEWTIQKATSMPTKLVITRPQTDTGSNPVIPTYSGPSDLKLKQRLLETVSSLRPRFNPLEQQLSSLLFQYYDTLFCERTVENADSLRRLACLHAVNHIFKYAPIAPRCPLLHLPKHSGREANSII